MSDRPEETDDPFEDVLLYLKESRGFDFTGYKRTSLMRRVRHRMTQAGIGGYADYIDHLQVNAEEFTTLFNTILINVTGFFRDADAWDALREQVITPMVAEQPSDHPIRVWSAGCASGQEAYSVAIMLAEAIGLDQFRYRVKIYATDVDTDALTQARQASYVERDLRDLPEGMAEKYFERQGDRFVFRHDLRRSLIFGRNDLVQDAPISRVDLLMCRNTLMYFTQETQATVLGRFNFALVPQGTLFLGKAEMLLSHNRMFEPVDLKRRIFRKSANSRPSATWFLNHALVRERRIDLGGVDHLREHAFSASPVAQVVVTGDDVVALVNRRAESTFGLSPKDVGRPLRDLDLSYRPVELRGYLERVRKNLRALRVTDVEWQRGTTDSLWFEVQVNPLINGDGGLDGVSIVFHDVSAARRLMDTLEHTNQRLERAYEELQSTNEELETTNEELQSTVEELQSTNEELETMNEELQSTNDELQTINDTVHERGAELDQVNEFLESILISLRAAVIVLDLQMHVLAWNRGAEELWGLRREEAEGQHLLNLDTGLPLTDLRPTVRDALSDSSYATDFKVPAVNRRGREVNVRIVCSSLRATTGAPNGAILVMEQLD